MLAAPLAHLLWAPVAEELFWRGFAQTCLGPRPEGDPGAARSLRAHLPAIAMAAALFALTHVVYLANPLSLHGLSRLATFFPGLLFGLVRLKGGDIYGAILLHALCNAWQFGLFSASA
ncbi:MAG: CPBP family glutamic-type intramembrane protease [Planctomycetota bacterium]|jgi:membrane protease YdiL (CAAX protease family)